MRGAMSFIHQDSHLLIMAAILIAIAFQVCSASAREYSSLQEELEQNHVTSPLVEGPDFRHDGDMTIFQGEFTEDEVPSRQERHVQIRSFYKWPGGVVPYQISNVFSSGQRQVIEDAMKHWEDNTCISFRPKVSTDVYSIYIMRDSGCYSFIGRISRSYQPQGVSLGNGCVHAGVVIHELGHAIGFFHEHTRPDRDQYIDVIYDNIRSGFADQFYKYSPGETDTLGLGYDIHSIMHYERRTFSRNGLDTIRPKVQNAGRFGSGNQLSALDIEKAKKYYNCPTPPPPTPPPTPKPISCGGELNTASGTFQTPNFPETYPVNIDCEWKIELPDTRKLVQIECELENYGIAGIYPSCTKDYLKLYDGHSKQDDSHGPYCQFTIPDPLKMTSNLAMAVFHAGPSHSPSRRGFKCNFQSINAPTIAPPTTLPPPPPPTTPPPTPSSICGGELNTASGSFQTPNFPETYPINIDCEWKIELPDARKLVQIECEPENYGIAGIYPSCTKDHLKFYDGHSKQDDSHGPYCQFTIPDPTKMSSNLAMAVFHAGPSHSPSRRGFKCNFQSVNAPTIAPPTTLPPPPPTTLPPSPPPTTPPPPPPTPSNLCGGELNIASGSFQSPNWPATYPVNIDCEWRIKLPDSRKIIELNCQEDPHGIAGTYPTCTKDYLKLYDGHSKQDNSHGPYCHFTLPNSIKMSSNLAMAVFHAGPRHSPSRLGFKCTFRSIDGPQQPTITTLPQTTAPPPSTTALPPATTSPTEITTSSPPPVTSSSSPPPPPSPSTPTGECPLQTVPQVSDSEGVYRCNSFVSQGTFFGLPGFPNIVSESTPQLCDWTIVTSYTSPKIRITYMDLPGSTNCSTHSLSIYDGLSNASPRLAKLCGNICQEQTYKLSGSFAFVELHMASRSDFRGIQGIMEQE